MMRKIFVTLLITCLLAVPIVGQLNFNVYAEDSTTVTREEAKEAFKAYCISRNLLVDGTVLGSAARWLGGAFDNAIDTLGIDIDYLQTQLSKVYSGTGFKWAFTASGIALYNRIFAELLQREDLEVGDTDVNKIVYSGHMFTSYEGDTCLIYNVNTTSTIIESNSGKTLITEYGTPLKYSGDQLLNIWTSQIGVESISNYAVFSIGVTSNYQYDGKLYYYSTPSYKWLTLVKPSSSNESPLYYNRMLVKKIVRDPELENPPLPTTGYGNPAIIKLSNDKIYFGFMCFDLLSENRLGMRCIKEITDEDYQPTDVVFKTPPDKSIEPDYPDDEPVNINPDGTTDDEPDDPDDPDDPIIPPDDPDAPTGGTPPDWSTDTDVEPDGDGWKIPFTLPDLDIDWSIDGLGSKFPFCIPRDLVALVGVLNVEPSPPRFTGTVDLFIYDWQVDIDFTEFETIGVIVRNGLFILFCIGLLVATRAIIRG